MDQAARRCGHFFNGSLESRLVGLRGHGKSTELADELERSIPDLQLSGRGLEVEQGLDVAAHDVKVVLSDAWRGGIPRLC